MTDGSLDDLMAQLGMQARLAAVRSLLAGNDTQCFTTRQYAERYHKIAHRDDPDHRDAWIKFLMELAPQHLWSVGCSQVKEGVWTR